MVTVMDPVNGHAMATFVDMFQLTMLPRVNSY